MLAEDAARTVVSNFRLRCAPFVRAAPNPRVPEPQRRKDVYPGRVRAAVAHGNFNEDIVRLVFRVLCCNVPVLAFVEYALKFRN